MDFHVVDKFNQASSFLKHRDIYLFSGISIENTDTKSSIIYDDKVIRHELSWFSKNNWLKKSQPFKNIVKAALYPLQIVLLRRLVNKNKNSIFHSFTMYYALLCYFSRLRSIVTPQGSEVLQRIDRSKVYKYFAIRALNFASDIIVDSIQMQNKLLEYGVYSSVFKNGFNTEVLLKLSSIKQKRDKVTSIRGFRSLYRIDHIVNARNSSAQNTALEFVYPSFDEHYKDSLKDRLKNEDNDLGMLDKTELYDLLIRSKLVISIPMSDSSPRSVYEAIFAGAAVAVTHAPYLEELPDCMKKRIIITDINEPNWFNQALSFSESTIKEPYIPSEEALNICDSNRTMEKICKGFYS